MGSEWGDYRVAGWATRSSLGSGGMWQRCRGGNLGVVRSQTGAWDRGSLGPREDRGANSASETVSRYSELPIRKPFAYHASMSTIVSRNVDDLTETSRQGLEQLLGARLEAHQRVYVIVEAPLAGPAEPERRQAARRLQKVIDRAQANADAHGITDQEMDSAVDEAMAHIRLRT